MNAQGQFIVGCLAAEGLLTTLQACFQGGDNLLSELLFQRYGKGIEVGRR